VKDIFWRDVQGSLVRRISHRKQVTGLDARAKLNVALRIPANDASRIALAKQLAKELVLFVVSHDVEVGKSRQSRPTDFRAYPTLQSAVSWLNVARYAEPTGYASRCNWTCSDTSCGGVALSLANVASAVQAKTRKAAKYRRSPGQELWLLISAAG